MSAKRKLLVVDTETGGLDPHGDAIISIAAIVWHEGGIDDRFYKVIRDPEGSLAPRALEVNGFTPERIEAEGEDPLAVVLALENFLLKNDMRNRITTAGHNVAFDLGFLRRLYRLAGYDFEKRFSHRALCTMTALLFLEQAGKLSLHSLSLDAVCKHFALARETEDGKHNALSDADVTAKLLTRLIQLV